MTTFRCDTCNRNIQLIQHVETLPNGIKRNYFECPFCKAQATIYYSDKLLRKMIKKQQKVTNQVTKKSLKKQIEQRMVQLKAEYGGLK